jgi:hypothetical protein
MDVWNAWDKDVVETLGNEKDINDVLEMRATFNNRESIIDIARKT